MNETQLQKAAQQLVDSEAPESDDGVVFEKAKPVRFEREKATPLSDSQGRPRWVPTRMCWCPKDARTDCRYHSTTERGWEKCPNENLSLLTGRGKVTPNQLYATNPDFGKPKQKPEEEIQ